MDERFDPETLDKRLRRLKGLMEHAPELVQEIAEELQGRSLQAIKQKLPDRLASMLPDMVSIPDEVVELLIDDLHNDEDLQELLDSIEEQGPPRLVLMGPTGVGKSSLVNALADEDIATVKGGAKHVTKHAQLYDYEKFNILDTRGLADVAEEDEASSREELQQAFENYRPHAVLFVVDATTEAGLEDYIEHLNELRSVYQEMYGGGEDLRLPVIVAANRIDEEDPVKGPEDFSGETWNRIHGSVDHIRTQVNRHDHNLVEVIPTAAYIEWDESGTKRVEEVTYNIDRLYEVIASSLDDFAAEIHFRRHLDLEDTLEAVNKKLSHSFARRGFAVAVAPIPGADFVPLLLNEVLLIMVIAYLSGREVEPGTAVEFFGAMGFGGMAGYLARVLARSFSGLNPLFGNLAAGPIAYSTTYAIGLSASRYFVRGDQQVLEVFKGIRERVSGMFGGSTEDPDDLDKTALPDPDVEE